MDPTGGIFSGFASLLGGALGASQAQSDRDQARQVLQSIMSAYGSIPQPVLDQMAAQQLGPSAMDGVQADPSLVQAQTQSLGQMQDIANAHGMTTGDQASMLAGQNEASQRNGAERQALENMLAGRGLGNSGAAIGLRIGGQRDSQDRQANTALQSTQDAQRRALQAIQAGGQMAGAMRGQGFAEASDRAKAKDLFAQYNANSRQRAQEYNLGLPQRRFDNQMATTQGMANASQGVANNYSQSADRTQRTYADVSTGLGQMGGAAVNYFGGGGSSGGGSSGDENPYYHSYPQRMA